MMRLLGDERGAVNRQEAYQKAIRLHEQGLGYRRIYKIMPQIPMATIGRWIYTNSTPDYSKNRPILSESPSLAYILGVLYGDGYTCIHKSNYDIGLRVKDKEFIDVFCEALNRIHLYPYIMFQEGKYYRAMVSSKIFVGWFRRLNFGDITNSSLGYEVYFIRGFYDSEGSLNQRWKRRTFQIYLANTNLEILQLIQRLLSKFGFQTSIYKIKTLKNHKQMYQLHLLGGNNEVIRFLKLIKPSTPRKSMGRIEELR